MSSKHVDGAVSEYREFRPTQALAEYLLCFWTQTIRAPVGFEQRVVPDCCIDILLRDDVPMVFGPWTGPFVDRLAPSTNIIGARFHPGLAPSLLGVPASDLLNRFVPLRDIWGRAETARFARIADQPHLSAKLSAMQAALLPRVATADPVDRATGAAIQWIARHPRGRVEQLSEWLGLSSRQIRRGFTMTVGYGPKLFQSVLRFQRVLRLASRTGVPWTLAQFAADSDYADQAHMTREVRRFYGNPPGRSLRSARCALRLSGLIETTPEPEF